MELAILAGVIGFVIGGVLIFIACILAGFNEMAKKGNI